MHRKKRQVDNDNVLAIYADRLLLVVVFITVVVVVVILLKIAVSAM